MLNDGAKITTVQRLFDGHILTDVQPRPTIRQTIHANKEKRYLNVFHRLNRFHREANAFNGAPLKSSAPLSGKQALVQLKGYVTPRYQFS